MERNKANHSLEIFNAGSPNELQDAGLSDVRLTCLQVTTTLISTGEPFTGVTFFFGFSATI